MSDYLAQYYRCPERFIRFVSREPLSPRAGYFQFGKTVTCYGKCSGGEPTESLEGSRYDCWDDVEISGGAVHLPFDPSEVVDNLRLERYVEHRRHGNPPSLMARIYYSIRPFLSASVRRGVQRTYFHDWKKIRFPRWPVDTSVDNLLQELLLLAIRSSGKESIPFIWFWPDGAPGCLIMTHDIETTVGRDFCAALMDIDRSFGMNASFQVVPEERYPVNAQFLSSIRERGFEVVVHDLNHDGRLYRDYDQFLERASKINAYGRAYKADGFRAGVMYRNQEWYDAFGFDYDMSVPNVAHLDSQRGGCCTVMPYFVGKIVELPVTASQDYTLFNILSDYSIDLWKRQIDLIMQNHGLMSFIVHPDYIVGSRERGVYEELLRYLKSLRAERNIWAPTPGEVNRWWRDRAQMTLVESGDGWRIEGQGAERARVAYASERDGRLVFTLADESTPGKTFHIPVAATTN